ncbi:swr complex subunit [Exserohilum turcicum]|uniref:SWR1-complex protein 5 n=1 Tax=Exserohilum turcicum (strain 28A) TaxID=671987 RepID=R0KAR7_EXST2|nr:uncharacterized protein SETTUDRAFT_179826 [Exserohilum turcica Et28A]EOA85352.1 hypothetical protein SETTUDRAFT_179826 [Exserohilum turcica Et28A]
MPHTYGDEDLETFEEKYHESSDDDFDPNAAPPEDASSSEDEDHVTIEPAQRKGKRKAPADEELDSGDEVTIQAARRKRSRKKGKKGSKNDDDAELIISDDEGGDGGLIKTRAQRRTEGKEARPLARTEGATVDVDALWAQMTAAPLKPLQTLKPQEVDAPKHHTPVADIPASVEEEEQLTIKKVFTFAGQDTTEEKQIPRSQLDAYLKDGWKPQDAPTAAAAAASPAHSSDKTETKIRRPLRRPSRFDPNPTGYVRALAPEFQLSWPRTAAATAHPETEHGAEAEATTAAAAVPPPTKKAEKTQKLNVVDKSRMDWTGFVDKEGIADELDTHGKTKEAYLGRMQFLAGVEARREEERRNAKIKAAAAATVASTVPMAG